MKKVVLFCLLGLTCSLYSCETDDVLDWEEEDETEQTEEPVIPEDPGDAGDDALVTNSQNVNYADAVSIAFSDKGATIDNPFEEKGVEIENKEGHVVIRSSVADKTIRYVLSGITTNGSVKIYGEQPVGLVLNGVGITNPTGAAINIQHKGDIAVVLVGKTNNRLIDGKEYTQVEGEDMKATFFSEGNLAFEGEGSLEIRGLYKHGLCTDGSLHLASGTLHIKQAASDGIHTNDEVIIAGGSLTIRAEGDGIDCESKKKAIEITGGTINITTTGEKAHGIKTKQDIEIDTDGSIDITVYGNASKGIKPSGNLTIRKGEITVNTAGDAIWEEEDQDTSSAAGIKCDGNMVMEDGTLTLLSTGLGGKGINVDGTLTIYNGTILATTTGDQYVYDHNNDTAAKAIKSDGDLTIYGGNIKIRTSKTEAEGLESKATLTIAGGTVDIEAYDDAINASTHIQIDGGTVYCKSAVNDALDSNGTLTVTGGTLICAGATTPEGGIDCDQSRFTITGGVIIGVGGDTSTPTSNVCTQRSLVFGSSTSKVKIIRIEATDGGEEILTFKLPKTYDQRMTLLFSSPALKGNTGYTVYTGGTITGGTSTYGMYSGATYTKGSSEGSFTTGSANGSVSTLGSTNSPGEGGPGRPW